MMKMMIVYCGNAVTAVQGKDTARSNVMTEWRSEWKQPLELFFLRGINSGAAFFRNASISIVCAEFSQSNSRPILRSVAFFLTPTLKSARAILPSTFTAENQLLPLFINLA
jgi:hypothetical protein